MAKFYRNNLLAFGVAFIVLSVVSYFFPAPVYAEPPKVSDQRQEFITYSLGYIGVPYVYGGKDWDADGGFDCSGYVWYVAKNSLGLNLSRTAQQMYDEAEIIDIIDREPGDLVFFKNNMNSSRITHVGIYLGLYNGDEKKLKGKKVFVSAVSDGPRRGITISAMDESFWEKHYFATGRILPPTVTETKADSGASVEVEK